jgi:hypothetical protein
MHYVYSGTTPKNIYMEATKKMDEKIHNTEKRRS